MKVKIDTYHHYVLFLEAEAAKLKAPDRVKKLFIEFALASFNNGQRFERDDLEVTVND